MISIPSYILPCGLPGLLEFTAETRWSKKQQDCASRINSMVSEYYILIVLLECMFLACISILEWSFHRIRVILGMQGEYNFWPILLIFPMSGLWLGEVKWLSQSHTRSGMPDSLTPRVCTFHEEGALQVMDDRNQWPPQSWGWHRSSLGEACVFFHCCWAWMSPLLFLLPLSHGYVLFKMVWLPWCLPVSMVPLLSSFPPSWHGVHRSL